MRRDESKRRGRRPATAAAMAAACALAAGAGVVGAEPAASAAGDRGRLEAVRAATEQYLDPAAAEADGFTPTNTCVPGMGYHYVRYDRFDARIEPTRPEVLVYAPTAEGRRLVAVEWVALDQDQALTTDGDRPSVLGLPFDGPMAGHEPGMPVHYDLHAWAWLDNPAGAFHATNPLVTCSDGHAHDH